jgi:murein DD-endopeptidase MepM/ murein hydrolase activator NlpD
VVAFTVDDPQDAGRRTEYLEQVNARDNAAVDALAALNEDLEAQSAELSAARSEQEEALASLDEQRKAMEEALAEATAAEQALEERLARESEARRAAAAAAAAPRPSTRTPGASSGPGTGQAISGLTCPVPGAAFSDDWGQPRSGGRSHQGTDMFAGMGAPNNAVIGGTVSVQSGGAGGNMLYLAGNDGNTYIYMHLSSYAVSSGSVSQGQVVAYLGDTGNASGTPHTHFEIHPGGGGAINPYPTLASTC